MFALQHEGEINVLLSRSEVSTAELLCSWDVVEGVSEIFLVLKFIFFILGTCQLTLIG